MPLQRTDTGETATPLSKPLQELQEHNITRKEQLDTALLKEALAISNENCNNLIERQNTLIEEQTGIIGQIPTQIRRTETRLELMVDRAVDQMKAESLKASQIKSEIRQAVKSEIMDSESEMRDYNKRMVDESLSETRAQLSATAKEIEKQREEYKRQGVFRKFFFWATPVLLLAQTILLALIFLR